VLNFTAIDLQLQDGVSLIFGTQCRLSVVGLNISCAVTDTFSVEMRNFEICVRGRSRSLKMAPFESSGTRSYSYSIATMTVSLAVSTQYTKRTRQTDIRPDRHKDTARRHGPRLCTASRASETQSRTSFSTETTSNDITGIR